MSEDQFAHLSPRTRERLEAEMQSGKDRQAAHAKTFKALEKVVDNAVPEDDPRYVNVDALVARRAADDKLAAARIAEAQEAAILANAAKEVADFNEANGLVPGFSDKVISEADDLASQRLEQSGMLEPLSIRGEAQEEAYRANVAKEVSDRVESPLYQGDTVFQGVTGEVDTGPRYDDDGALIENEVPENTNAPYTEATDTAAIISTEQVQTQAKKRGRPRKASEPDATSSEPVAQGEAVAHGPKSE